MSNFEVELVNVETKETVKELKQTNALLIKNISELSYQDQVFRFSLPRWAPDLNVNIEGKTTTIEWLVQEDHFDKAMDMLGWKRWKFENECLSKVFSKLQGEVKEANALLSGAFQRQGKDHKVLTEQARAMSKGNDQVHTSEARELMDAETKLVGAGWSPILPMFASGMLPSALNMLSFPSNRNVAENSQQPRSQECTYTCDNLRTELIEEMEDVSGSLRFAFVFNASSGLSSLVRTKHYGLNSDFIENPELTPHQVVDLIAQTIHGKYPNRFSRSSLTCIKSLIRSNLERLVEPDNNQGTYLEFNLLADTTDDYKSMTLYVTYFNEGQDPDMLNAAEEFTAYALNPSET